jgi:hypothetical protein
MGFLSFAGGAMGLLILMFEEMGETGWRLPMRYYAMVVGLISGGISHDRHCAGLGTAAVARWQGETVPISPASSARRLRRLETTKAFTVGGTRRGDNKVTRDNPSAKMKLSPDDPNGQGPQEERLR